MPDMDIPEFAEQILPVEAYNSADWFEKEQRLLFSDSWQFAGLLSDFKKTGDYQTVNVGRHSIVILFGKNGNLKAYHNICRHRGTELLEGTGNVGSAVVCPYHFWSYNLDGSLRAVPKQKTCFPDLNKEEVSLFEASVEVFQGLVFVNPSNTPKESLQESLSGLEGRLWPHDLAANDLTEFTEEIVYEMKCNWKVFYENAIDGYHLAYLHKDTLGGPQADKNAWEAFGRNLMWYSTEIEGVKHRVPLAVDEYAKSYGAKMIKGSEKGGYGGVYMLFPTTLIVPTPYSFSISTLEPIAPDVTLMRVRSWTPKSYFGKREKLSDIPGYDPVDGRIKSSHWTKHPLETGDFQTEDVWVCEKMQRAMNSPAYKVYGLAQGSGGEAALTQFQKCVAEIVDV